MTIQPGVILKNQYRADALIGSGGMAVVYRGYNLNLQHVCAIKQNMDTSPQAQRQFHLEAILLANLSHSHLARVTDHFIDVQGQQYLVMDFIEGEDLASYVERNGPLPEALALAWLRGVLEALAYCHSQGVIHRDIKPANLIKRQGQDTVVLVDFGIAKQQGSSSLTMTGARAASPAYAPLEQFTGHTDVRSDLYSLGATLYYLLSGQQPPDARLLASGVMELTPLRQLNPTISRQTEQAVQWAMALRMADRPANVSALQTALFYAGAMTAPVSQPGPVPVQRPRLRPIWLVTAAAGLGLLLLLYTLMQLNQPDAPSAGANIAHSSQPAPMASPAPDTGSPATATQVAVAETSMPSSAIGDGRLPTSTPIPATDTPTPTVTPSPPPPGLPGPLPTVTATASPIALLPAPELTGPEDSSEARATITWQWRYDRPLAAGQQFRVYVRTEHNQPIQEQWFGPTDQTSLVIRFADSNSFFKDDGATYFWSVEVIEDGKEVSARSAERRFVFRAAAPPRPTPTTTSPPLP